MKSKYFKDATTKYFGDEPLKESSKQEDVKKFDISTDKYKKTKMKVEIVEYEIKDWERTYTNNLQRF